MKVIDFYGNRKIYFTIVLVGLIFGIIMTCINGVRLDIQFKGGAILKYNYTGDIDAEKAGEIATKVTNRVVTPQITSDLSTGEKRLIINIAGDYGLDVKEQEKLYEALKEEFPDADLNLSESAMVEPFFGRKFLKNGILSILLGSLFVVIYVWIRFRRIGGLSAGIMALVALFLDVLIVFFTHTIFKIPIGDSFIAVALTIIGYSINDTIVVYDRIRENAKKYPRMPVDKVTNLSITQSMTRSINTNVAVFISVAVVYILAVANSLEAIKSFALPMVTSTISGCFTSLCISGPLWVSYKKHQEKKKATHKA